MTIHFGYDKKQVLEALRYHFLTRPEIRILLIVVNVFAILSGVLFVFKEIQPLAFLLFSFLWFFLMLTIWRLLPRSIYKKASTFQDDFSMTFQDEEVVLENDLVQKHGPGKISVRFWKALISFTYILTAAHFSWFLKMRLKILWMFRKPGQCLRKKYANGGKQGSVVSR